MRNLAKVILAVAIWQAMVGSASAGGPEPPFVKVLMSQDYVDLGTVWGPGTKIVGTTLNARVLANCPFRIAASFRGFAHEEGKGMIPPKNLSVVINGKDVPVGPKRVPIAESNRPTPSNGVNVPIGLHVGVKGLAHYPAGRYNGMLVLTVMAGP